MPATVSSDRVREGVFTSLHRCGWTDTDVQALIDDWPTAATDRHRLLASRALFLTGDHVGPVRLTPAQVRSWLRVLQVPDGPSVTWSPAAVAWFATEVSGDCMDGRILVGAYQRAAGGDHEIAVLAFAAGLPVRDLAGRVGAGEVTRESLRVLAALID